jgi:hypothetical protein
MDGTAVLMLSTKIHKSEGKTKVKQICEGE